MSNTATNPNVVVVRTIGKGERLTVQTAALIVAAMPEDYDWTARGAVPQAILAWACPDGDAPAQKTGPKGDQTPTDFGRGVDRLRKAVADLVKAEKPKPVKMQVTLSGDDAPITGTVTIPTDSPLFATLVAMIAEQSEAAAA